MTKPTVYYYFADKGTLLTAVICSVLEQHGGGLRPAARRGARARDRLASAVAYLVGAKCSGPRLLRDGGLVLTVDQTSQARSAFFRHFFSPLQQILDEGVRSGELRQLDTAFATQAIFNLLDPWTGRDPLPGGRDPHQLAQMLPFAPGRVQNTSSAGVDAVQQYRAQHGQRDMGDDHGPARVD